MARLLLTLFLAAGVAVTARSQDLHLNEPGSAVVLSHSAFAHGYRHGYEEGYHTGNTDISLGSSQRRNLKDFRGVKLGYTEQFGPRKVFERGFVAGLKAGYGDGYSGRPFRAIDTLRSVSASLEDTHSATDLRFIHFDQGFLSGYNEGFDRGGTDQSSTAQVDFHFVDCANFQTEKQSDLPSEASYCEGYRRGFALGHADGFLLRPESGRLEASK
jgi:hypothetical protein